MMPNPTANLVGEYLQMLSFHTVLFSHYFDGFVRFKPDCTPLGIRGLVYLFV